MVLVTKSYWDCEWEIRKNQYKACHTQPGHRCPLYDTNLQNICRKNLSPRYMYIKYIQNWTYHAKNTPCLMHHNRMTDFSNCHQITSNMLSKQYPMSPFTPFLCFFVQFLVLVRFAELGIPGDEYIAGFAFISNKIRFMKLNVCKGGYTMYSIHPSKYK